MIARSLNHVSFAVRDLTRSLAFYRDLLGLETLPRPDFGFPGAWLGSGGAQIHLIEVPADFDAGTPPPTLNPLGGHTAFAIDDYDGTLAALRGRGLDVLAIESSRQMWVKDPDGNVIELIAGTR